MSNEIGEQDYRLAAQERLREAKLVYDRESFAGTVYLAGRAVESILRGVIWRFDPQVRTGNKTLDTGHDLRELLREIIDLGVVPIEEERDELLDIVQYVARLWFNNMRFVPTRKLKAMWWRKGEVHRRRDLKRAVMDYYNSCASIVQLAEALCQK